jgi:hypothetical protein
LTTLLLIDDIKAKAGRAKVGANAAAQPGLLEFFPIITAEELIQFVANARGIKCFGERGFGFGLHIFHIIG